MKWKRRLVKPGDKRVITFFAWFPVIITTDEIIETRWLQTVKIRQEYIHRHWDNIEFVD